MIGTFLITSVDYAGPDFVSTFGLLPPAFLPVGNQRLYEHQAALITGLDCRKILSVPDDFEIEENETARLAELGFDLIRVPTGISLGTSIAHVMDAAGSASEDLRILHGDTHISELPLDQTDIVSEGTSSEYSAWAECRPTDTGAIEFTDGKIMTGAGVSAGIDMGLTLLAEVAGVDHAQFVQLMPEYDPPPPFSAGSLKTAPDAVREKAEALLAG